MNKKPAPRKKIYDYSEIIDYVETKYHFNSTDYANSHPHFNAWANELGYGDTDPYGKSRGSSQIWYEEYRLDPCGEAKRPPYLNFWHWLYDSLGDVTNGMTCTLDIKEWLSQEDNPAFVNTILNYLRVEFGERIECKIEW